MKLLGLPFLITEIFVLHRIALPTLKQALAVSKGKIMVDLDLKTDKIDEVMAVVKEMDMLSEVIFFDSDWEILEKIKAKMPTAYLLFTGT
ncbi:hypothetical protein SYJ56_03455 [Algoriphagus sp. D3-2-R+10]|uniref:hypothetical protein n=1 Tax=Algoriphagus aurantiacus TaxID=3103948 RepID=UPI002B3DA259|nr:hypothetical protein [Algoriphagus sp. D3-2-R+10]MEB2774345.1 hypothetical protein [Algoriphagus sp. D3-2-R+10]